AGVIELESQTSNLLSFHAIEKKVFDAQVAFNLLAGYGEKRKPSLEEIRERVASETSQYLDHRTIAPAIQLIQAPVFYGYAFAAYVDFASEPKPAEIEAAFVIEGVEVTAKDDAAPDNVSAAGMSEIQIGRVGRDPNVPTGAWLWGVADNLNLAATNAVRIAEELLAVPE
ncbi:MAG: Asd/ArgC dimerization domain-containing protein, partial [Candidatus Acidiferrales bacterium]